MSQAEDYSRYLSWRMETIFLVEACVLFTFFVPIVGFTMGGVGRKPSFFGSLQNIAQFYEVLNVFNVLEERHREG